MLALLASLAFAADLPDLDEPLRTGQRAPGDAAVVVGLEDYVFLPDVPYARRDAELVTDFLVSSRGVPMERVRTLTTASREQIVAAVKDAGAAAGEGGTVWVYFAGHGVAAPSDGRRLLLGDDARQAPEAFEARGVHVEELESLGAAGGARVVLLVDACFNGTGRSGDAVVAGTRFAVPDYAAGPAPAHLHWAAAGPDQVARPLDAVAHGAFTWLAIGALRGWADGEVDGRRDGTVTAAEAQVYVARALRAVGVAEQQPVLRARQPDGWVLSPSASEAAPELRAAAFVATPKPVQPQQQPVVAALRFDPDLLAAATTYGVTLPLRRTTFGYKDAAGEKVRGDTYMDLVRATREGRSAIGMRSGGIALTVVGWAATFGFGTAAIATDGSDPWAVPAVGGLVGMFTGVGLVVGGQMGIQAAVEPELPGKR